MFFTKGGFGEDRKDIGKLIKIFYESFANKKDQPALVLKTSGATFSILDNEDVKRKISEIKNMFPSDWNLPKVYLLHGDLTDEEINGLYNHPKIKSFVSLTHGEGFGRPLLEATFCDLPVIASNWSGQVDFLSPSESVLLGGDLASIPKSVVWENVLIEESRWFNVNEDQVYKSLNYAHKEVDEINKKAKKLGNINRNKFSRNKMTEKLGNILENFTKHLPTQVGLQLPKLQKV